MLGAAVTRADRPAVALPRFAAIPVWAVLLLAYGASRVWSFALLAVGFGLRLAPDWNYAAPDPSPDFFSYLLRWDADLYRQIATTGYPRELPLDPDGSVAKNPWAFLPAFPYLARLLVSATGLDFAVVGVVISLLFGAGAVLLLHRVLLDRVDERSAFWGAILFTFGPMSFLLVLPYAEAMFLFFLFGGLLALQRRRYATFTVVTVAAAFTHPGALALPAALGITLIVRWVKKDAPPPRELAAILASGVITAVAGFAWPVVASVVTGTPDAYFETELAWWADYVGVIHFVPFTPSFLFAHRFLGRPGLVLTAVVVAALVTLFARRPVRALGVEIHAYAASYVAYLLAVFLPQQSTFRMLLPLSPLLGHPALTSTPARRGIALGISLVGQGICVLLFWVAWPP
jgi:hypothetical protein